MSRYVFVPLTDEILYEHPEFINGPVVPYRPGWPCHHWLSVELNPETDPPVERKPRPRPTYRLELLVGAGSHSH